MSITNEQVALALGWVRRANERQWLVPDGRELDLPDFLHDRAAASLVVSRVECCGRRNKFITLLIVYVLGREALRGRMTNGLSNEDVYALLCAEPEHLCRAAVEALRGRG